MKIQRFKGTFLRFRRTKGVNFRENSARCGTVFACRALVTIDFGSMGIIEKLRMRYLYRGEWREKYVTLESVWKWMREGKYQNKVEATQGLEPFPAHQYRRV